MILFSVKFPWAQNKLAVVENDKEYEYEAVQYSIKNHFELEIRKNPMGNTKWLVLQKLPGEKEKRLVGKTRVFSDAKAKNPRHF